MPQSMGELEYEQQPRNQERLQKKKEKKWTLGNLFRRKKAKESESDSSDSEVEDGKKGGFLARRRRRRAANRGSKDVSQSFEHVVLRPNASGNIGYDGKKSLKARVEASRDSLLKDSSSEEECSPRSKPRAPRSKRSSRDMSDCNMKVVELDSSPRSPRWTAKVVYCESSDYEARYTAHTRSATPSPAQSPIAKVKHLKRPPIPQSSAPRPLHCQKSASFDILPRQQTQLFHHPLPPQHQYHQPQLHSRVPPPPPPRDPQRKIIPPLGYLQDRPLSYAFESNQPLPKVMTDHNSNITAYKVNSSSSLDHQPVYKVNSSGSLDHRRTYQYYTDQQPRSRRPIHIARVDQPYLSDSQVGRIRTGDWRLPRDSNSSLCDSSDSREGGTDIRPLSMVMETTEQQSLQHQELPEKKEQKRKSSNLEDALNELEAIYKSLQLRDEEPLSRGFESDSGYYRVVDDMAYRRLNKRESGGSPDCRRVMSQAGSYLLVSPTLSPPPFAIAPPIPPPQNEPDVTLDDVVYRNIRHTNNTLKVADPQPPFGIPIGPVAPAANSDYLHATPKQLYRPTFKPRKTPDIVKDDLAYRSLRKDGQQDSLLVAEDGLVNDTPTILKKKRAVRSLSANLLSIIQKEQFRIENQNNKNYNYDTDNFEKTQSYSDLPDILDARYKRCYSTEDSDVTPRVSRLYPDMPISTTSTETLTDSRANIMNAQESCSIKNNQYVPFASNKPLPKTDFAKFRLPSPSSNQVSPPKKFLQNVETLASDQSAEKFRPQNSFEHTVNKTSSPFSSSHISKPLNSMERNNSKSPSPYYSASEAPLLVTSTPNSNKFVSSYNAKENKTNINNITSFSHNSTKDANLGYNGALSPSARRRGCDSSREENKLPISETTNCCNGESRKIGSLNTHIIESNRCVSQSPLSDSPRNENQSVKSSSLHVGNIQTGSLEKIKNNLERNSQAKSSDTPKNNRSVSGINYSSIKSVESTPDDFVTELSPVPLNPPKISIKERVVKEEQKINTVSKPSSAKSDTNSGFSSKPINFIGPVVKENKISIEGVTLTVAPEIKKPEKSSSDRISNLCKEPNKKFQQNTFSPLLSSSTTTSHSQISKARVPSPRLSSSHEKSHQKIDSNAKSSHSQCLKASDETGNNDTKSNKAVIPRPRSSINSIKSPEKNKIVTSRPKSSVTHDTHETKPRVPSPCLYLNADKHVLDDRVKAKSSSPRLSVEINKSRLPSPRLSVTPEKSPVRERKTNSSPSYSCNLKNSTDDASIKSNSSKTSDDLSRTQSSSPYELTVSLLNDNIVNSCTENVTKTNYSEPFDAGSSENVLMKTNKKLNDNVSSDNGAKCTGIDSSSLSSPYMSSALKDVSPSFSSEDKKSDPIKIKSGTRLNVQKDINQLLNEINDKQGEILCGKSKDVSCCSDKKDSLALGKITPHKPVKLTTFSINDNAIENNETIVLPNRENEIIGTSESMTDLLRELTRSLDQDFGSVRTQEDENKGPVAEDEHVIERTNPLLDKERLNDSFKSSDSQELNNTDEADNEVMEINRVVLEQNENKSSNTNVNSEHRIGFVAVKSNHKQTIGKEDNKVSEKCETVLPDEKPVAREAESCDVLDKQDYCSDDSNAEFVEAICKTASELSALSSRSNVTSTSGAISSSQQISSDPTTNSSIISDHRIRWSQPQQSHSGNLDHNEGERS